MQPGRRRARSESRARFDRSIAIGGHGTVGEAGDPTAERLDRRIVERRRGSNVLGIRATAEPDDHRTADRLARSCEGVVKAIVAGHVDAGALFDHACLVIPSSGPGWPDDTAWLVAGMLWVRSNETASISWAEAVSYGPFTLLRSKSTPLGRRLF